MSLDGFIAGPNDSVERLLGEGGERLHEWVHDLASWREHHGGREGGKTDTDAEVLDESFKDTGAVVVGRRMFDVANGWGDNPRFHMPVFVITLNASEKLVKEGGMTFTFVTDGIERALEQAKAAAGDEDASVAGGANIVQQYLSAGLLDEIQIHLVPVLLGDGERFKRL